MHVVKNHAHDGITPRINETCNFAPAVTDWSVITGITPSKKETHEDARVFSREMHLSWKKTASLLLGKMRLAISL